jgi:hypothetical protein
MIRKASSIFARSSFLLLSMADLSLCHILPAFATNGFSFVGCGLPGVPTMGAGEGGEDRVAIANCPFGSCGGNKPSP